ncbi:hypothetical protein SAMN05421781_0412 [Marinococcus luteus]|jgi:hypothetical protein|uniref:Yip1 domain-containing protein n=1 Tax=Marinococcus luteus TaxID=1122204 RepID=A0A1H2QR34_9BACI|nr:hypothetical protein [Marinococcus luteus]SDW09074.1 hypothetical protein SAMN05421781_0412 [Marinococcus luteus]
MFTSILQLPFKPRKQFAFLTDHYPLPLAAAIILSISILHTFITNYISLGTNQSQIFSDDPWLLVLAVLFGGISVFILPVILKGASSIYDHSLSYQKAFWVNILTIIPSLFLLPVALIGLFLFLTQGSTPALFTNVYRVLEWLSFIWIFVVAVGTIQVAANTSRPKSLTIAFTYFCFTVIAAVVAVLFLAGFFATF